MINFLGQVYKGEFGNLEANEFGGILRERWYMSWVLENGLDVVIQKQVIQFFDVGDLVVKDGRRMYVLWMDLNVRLIYVEIYTSGLKQYI